MMNVRFASSLLLIAGSEEANTPPKVVTIKRGSNVNYMPGTKSLPGGNFDESDEHVDWLSIIPFEEQVVYLNTGNVSPASIPRALSQRITAIRETFEECGILLCKIYNTPKTDKVIPVFISDINGWRDKLRQNSYEFLNLCRSYRCHPDVNNLYLVSRWLTPFQNSRRYDCNTYAAITDHVLEGEVDAIEVESMEVCTQHQICIDESTGKACDEIRLYS